MADLNYFINNVLSPPPNNWQGTEIELAFTNNSPDASIKTTNYEWLGEDAATLFAWYKAGLMGGNGIFEGVPFRIETCDPKIIVFDGCIDMSSEETTFQCDIIKASCIETNRIQFLNDRVDGFTFSYLRSIGSFGSGRYATTFTNADYIKVPYVISTIPDWLQVVILMVTFLEMIKLIKDSIEQTVGYIQAAAASYPLVWAMAVYSALATASILYSLFLTLLMVNIILLMINEIVQPIKFKYAMKVLTLFQKGAAFLDLGFSSTILQGTYQNACIMPKKSAYILDTQTPDVYLSNIFTGFTTMRKIYSDPNNTRAYGYYEGTFGQLIREMEDVFNAKVVVRNNILYFERWDYWNNNAVFTMPNQSSEAPFCDPYGTNAHELTSNYFIKWQQDSTDENTIDQYDGVSCQMTLKPLVYSNPKNILLKGLTEKTLNFALAKRKLTLTTPEKVINNILDHLAAPYALLGFWDNTFAIHTLPALPNNVVNNRVGAMLLSCDFTGFQKFFVIEKQPKNWNGVIAYNLDANNTRTDHLGYTDAYYLAKNYHSASWAVDTINGATKYPNQYQTYKDKEVPLCCDDFSTLRENNIINSWDMKKGRVDSIRWNPFTETAKIDFKIKEVFTKNLGQTIVIDGQ